MLQDKFKYNFPEQNSDPFDIKFDGNYFVYADKYSNLSKTLADFTLESFNKHIPMGYKTIIICHRINLLQIGQEAARWPSKAKIASNSDPYTGKYLISSNKPHKQFVKDWSKQIESTQLFKPNSETVDLNALLWDDFDSCFQFAKLKSIVTKSDMLISIVLETINWH